MALPQGEILDRQDNKAVGERSGGTDNSAVAQAARRLCRRSQEDVCLKRVFRRPGAATEEMSSHPTYSSDVWPFLNDTTAWPTYDGNASDIRFHDGSDPELSAGAVSDFTTLGFPVEAEVTLLVF